MRRLYKVDIVLNGIAFDQVVVDPHFEIKHSRDVDDDLIINLLQELSGMEIESDSVDRDGFQYFVADPVFFKGTPYRLIWLIDPEETYIGVVNCYRRSRK